MQIPSSGGQGRISVLVETPSVAVAPGASVTMPVVLTNHGLDRRNRVPGQAPAGFVPVPHRGPPEVLPGRVRWEAPDGWHEVVLP